MIPAIPTASHGRRNQFPTKCSLSAARISRSLSSTRACSPLQTAVKGRGDSLATHVNAVFLRLNFECLLDREDLTFW
eukprot:1094126-Rhodomonas_salina.1